MRPLLEVTGLRVELGPHAVVDGVDLAVVPGEVLGLAGESGCGKSMLALAVLGLLPTGGRITAGQVRFDGADLAGPEALRAVRGAGIAMVFQDPMSCLHPTLSIGTQICEALRAHQPGAKLADLRTRALAALGQVGLPDPVRAARALPHQLSGGECQRAMIAMALAGEPALVIADEPTTALDATVAAAILDLLGELQRARGLALLLISHDLGMLAARADRLAVMYAGRIIEQATAADLFADPQHPYTLGLLASQPRLGGETPRRLPAIAGQVPAPGAWPTGCRFRPRCPFAVAACAVTDPALRDMAPGHVAACIRAPLDSALAGAACQGGCA